MSSRRKQSKPKSFGVNETIEDVSFNNKPEDNTISTLASAKSSTHELVSSSSLPSNLPPIPSTDLLSFNLSNNNDLTNHISDNDTNRKQNEEIQHEQTQTQSQSQSQSNQFQEEHQQPEINLSNESETHLGGEYSQMNDLNDIEEEEDDDEATNENDYNLEDDYIEELDNQSFDNAPNRLIIPLTNESGSITTNKSNVNYSQSMSILNSTLNDSANQSGDQSNLLQFKCKVCGKGFKHRRSLNRHVRLHSGEKNYKCPHCTTAFARSDHLKAHIRTHNNSKPYRCAVCQCGYNTQAALKVHIAHHHSKSKFKCALCNNMEFHSQLALEGHMYTKHSQANTEIDIETAMITTHHHSKSNNVNNSINNNHHDLNENGFHDTYHKSDQINNNLNQQRVKLADINNYNSKDDDHVYSNNYLNVNNTSNSNSENRENLNKSDSSQIELTIEDLIETNNNNDYDELNESANTSETQSQSINHNDSNQQPETATIIDNYGEDDDEENHSDMSSSSHISKNHDENCSKESLHNKSNEDLDDIIIEENLSSSVKLVKPNVFISNQKRIVPKTLPPPPILGPNSNINKNIQQQKSMSIPPPLLLPANRNTQQLQNNKLNTNTNRAILSSNNTYCEMCNARFSSAESFQAHMRNCHPHLVQQQQTQQIPVKMPYLSNILSKPNGSANIVNGAKPIAEPSGGIIITNNGIIITPANAVSKLTNNCTRPNCNCAISPNRMCSSSQVAKKDDELDYYYAIKETHYTCSQCNSTFFKINDYMAHLKQEHCVEVYRCILCKQMQLFDNLNLLKEHFFQEHQSQKFDYFRCRLCINPVPNSVTSSLLFNNIDDLNNHLKSVHHINPSSQPSSIPASQSTTTVVASMPINNKILLNSQIPIVTNSLPMPPPPPPPPPPPVHLPLHVSSQQPIPIYSQIQPSSHQYGPPPPPPPPLPPSQFNSFDRFNSFATNNKCFKCNYCDSDFAQQSYLNQHIQMVHGSNKLNTNPVLNNNFNTNTNTNNQQQPQQIYSCQFCRNTFTNRSQLERHVRIHVSSIDLKCNICDKSFESQELLSQHKLTHCKTFNDVEQNNNTNSKPNGAGGGSITDGSVSNLTLSSSSSSSNNNNSNIAICVYCKQTIDNESIFKEHFKRHNNIGATNTTNGTKANSFICIVCRQTLTSNSEYNLHMRHHLRRISINANNNNNGTQQQIQQQQSQVSNKSNQQPPTNSNDKNDQERSNNETNHQTNHNSKTDNSSKLRCSKCLVKFEVWQELADHIAEVHSQSAPIATLASKPTETSSSSAINDTQAKQISIKQERRSPESNLTQQEPKKPRLEETQFNMLITDNIMCEICSSKFDSNTKLQCHLLVKHEFVNTNNILTCPVCDESFTRPDVLIQHTQSHGPAARIYKCTECSQAFVFKAQLINHSFSHHQLQRSAINDSMKRQNPIPVQTNFNKNNINNQMNMIRPPNRPQIPNQSYVQYQQQQAPIQRFRCNDCSIDFSSFRFYQHHCQTVHNRTMISNTNGSSIIG